MPDKLPLATADQLELAARDHGSGYDTAVADFFGASMVEEDIIPTEVEGGDSGKSARERVANRAKPVGSPLR